MSASAAPEDLDVEHLLGRGGRRWRWWVLAVAALVSMHIGRRRCSEADLFGLEARRDTAPMSIVGVHHVSVNVADVEAALEFYVHRLGLTARTDRPDLGVGGAWLDAGSQQVHLIVAPVPEDKGQHLAFHVPDLDRTVEGLRAGGIVVSDPVPIGTGRQAFLRDPSGNLVELHQPA